VRVWLRETPNCGTGILRVRLFAPCTLDYSSQLHVLGHGSLGREAALTLQMVRKTAAAVWAALVTALMILSGFTTEAVPAAKSLKTLVEGLEQLQLKA